MKLSEGLKKTLLLNLESPNSTKYAINKGDLAIKETEFFSNMKGGFLPMERKEEWKREVTKFNEYLKPLSKKVHNVEGDGNCLFYALSDQDMLLNEGLRDHNNFRMIVTNNLQVIKNITKRTYRMKISIFI